jgi:uncharacterized protein YlxW (UPF0749 family)
MGKDFAPMIASIFVMMIPIIAILTRHQQKMTLLMRQDNQSHNPELYALQNDVHELKSMVSSIAMSVDDLKNEVRSNSLLQDRVKVGE